MLLHAQCATDRVLVLKVGLLNAVYRPKKTPLLRSKST